MKRVKEFRIFSILFQILKVLYIIMIFFYLSFTLLGIISIYHSILGYRFFAIKDITMQKDYPINDIVIVKEKNGLLLKVGDDIAYHGNAGGFENHIVIHRIVRIQKEEDEMMFFTKGISSNVEDPSILESQIIGKVIYVLPILSFLNHIFQNMIGFSLFVFCPLVIYLVVEVFLTIKEIKQEKSSINDITIS